MAFRNIPPCQWHLDTTLIPPQWHLDTTLVPRQWHLDTTLAQGNLSMKAW